MENFILENLEYLKSIKCSEYLEWATTKFELSLLKDIRRTEEFLDKKIELWTDTNDCVKGSDIKTALAVNNVRLENVKFELMFHQYDGNINVLHIYLNERIPNPDYSEYILLLRERYNKREQLNQKLHDLEYRLSTIIKKKKENETT